jgi:hypothetical protein
MFGMPRLQELINQNKIFDPTDLDDPLACHIDWTEAVNAGSKFSEPKLVKVNNYRYEFRESIIQYITDKLFLIVLFMLLTVLISWSLYSTEYDSIAGMLYFLILFLFVLYLLTKGLFDHKNPTIFDKIQGIYWEGHTSSNKQSDIKKLQESIPLMKIRALQLIAQIDKNHESTSRSYELNLVLANGERINVVEHNNLSKLRKDALSLSEFLGKPLWNAV